MLAGCTAFTSAPPPPPPPHHHHGLLLVGRDASASCQRPGPPYSFSNFHLFQQPHNHIPIIEEEEQEQQQQQHHLSGFSCQNASSMEVSTGFPQDEEDEEEDADEKETRSAISAGSFQQDLGGGAGDQGVASTFHGIPFNNCFNCDSDARIREGSSMPRFANREQVQKGEAKAAVANTLFLDPFFLDEISQLGRAEESDLVWKGLKESSSSAAAAESIMEVREEEWGERAAKTVPASQPGVVAVEDEEEAAASSWAVVRSPDQAIALDDDDETTNSNSGGGGGVIVGGGLWMIGGGGTAMMMMMGESPPPPDPKKLHQILTSEPCSVLDLAVSPCLKPRVSLETNLQLLQPQFSDLSGPSLPPHQRGREVWFSGNPTQSFTLPAAALLPVRLPPSPVCQTNNNAWVDSIISEQQQLAGRPSSQEQHHYCHKLSQHMSESQQFMRSEDALVSGTDSGDETYSDDVGGLHSCKILRGEGTSSLDHQGGVEEGVELINLLVACVEAISTRSLTFINHLLARLGRLASPNGSSVHRVAAYFTEGLACRVSKIWPQVYQPLPFDLDICDDDLLSAFQVLNHATPFVKFSHFTANDMILRAFEGEDRVHVIDFDIKQGLQWPSLFHSLATRSGGPPSHIRITGVGECKEDLQDTGDRLAEFAEDLNLTFEFHAVMDKLEDVRLWMLHVKEKEAVAINCLFQLHKTLHDSGAAIKDFLSLIQSTRPKVVALVEQEASLNQPSFEGRFVEALQYYCAIFDSLEASLPADSAARLKAELLFAREIRNVVGCEGAERTERCERVGRWKQVMEEGGFGSMGLTQGATMQAHMLLTMFSSSKSYNLIHHPASSSSSSSSLTLAWLDQPLFTASAWAPKKKNKAGGGAQ